MAGGVVETDPIKLAALCDAFQNGTKKLFDEGGDMWFFELYHHLTDCAAALRSKAERPHMMPDILPMTGAVTLTSAYQRMSDEANEGSAESSTRRDSLQALRW